MVDFRKATLQDADLILKWRNDDRIRLNALNTAIIDFKHHKLWLSQILASESVFLFIAEINKIAMAVLRFDCQADVVEVNFYLDPEKKGQGLGKEVLKDGLDLAKKNFPNVKKMIAKILPDNYISIKTFEYLGFEAKYIQFEKDN